MAKLFFIGDSITVGAWDENGGWANRIANKLMQQTMEGKIDESGFYCMPYNLGISGDTVPDILRRLEREVSERLDQDDPNEKVEFVISIGVNDSAYFLSEHRPRFTDEEFKNNLIELVSLSHKFAHRLSFIGIAPVDDDLLNPIPWAPEKVYACEHVHRFENIISSVCSEQDLPFYPLYERWLSVENWKSYLFDGIHPNSEGHALLSKQIESFIFSADFEEFHTS